MAGMRPGGMSDDDYTDSDDDEIITGGNTSYYGPSSNALNGQSKTSVETNSGLPRFASSSLRTLQNGLHCSTNVASDVPAVVSSTVDNLVSLDDIRLAIQKNNIETLEKLLSYGVDVNTPLSSGWTALMYAAHSSASACINVLLRYGANPNSHKDKYSVLMAACGSTCNAEPLLLESVNVLIEFGAEANASDRHNMNPLMYASRQGRATVVDLLIPLTSDINQQDDKGYTALMWAVTNGHTAVIRALVDAGADLSKRKADGKSASDIAALKGRKEILQLLRGLENPSAEDADVVDAVMGEPSDVAANTRCLGFAVSASPSLPIAQVPVTSPAPSVVAPVVSRNVSFDHAGANDLGAGDGVKVDGVSVPAEKRTIVSDTSAPSVTTYGELELFLSGLDLSTLIPTFQQQQVTFTTFLRLTDVDLQQMGVTQLGVRKKILDAIRETHKKNWETSSLASIQYNKKISCSDSVVMLANIKQHAAYIASTIGYIDDQISADNKIVLNAPQDPGAGVKDLCINTEEAIVNVKNLFAELIVLRKHLEKICHNREFQPPELVPKLRRHRSRWTRWRRVLLFGGFVAGCTTIGVILVKNARQ